MPPSSLDWASAFARQAQADFRAWNVLESSLQPALAACQSLHFLQMACEKLCKAQLCHAGSDPIKLQASHAYVSKNLPAIVGDMLKTLKAKRAKIAALVRFTKQAAREIELLAPAVDDGGRRPDNSEYPWKDGRQRLHVPVDWTYPISDLLIKPPGLLMLKLIASAIDSLIKNPAGA